MDHLSTKRILITGGLGYIASEIFKIVKEYSGESLAVDKLADASGNVLILDLKDAAKTSEVINNFNPHVIIHCATHSALAYKDHLLNSFQEDFSATVNILDALSKMPDCRLMYFSSSYVYSGLPAQHPYDEYSPLAPKHNFGIAKSFFEQFILKIHPNTVIFRLCSVFGSGQALHPNVILAFAQECLKNNSLTVWGKGDRKLQYIYIKDVVNVILKNYPTGLDKLGSNAWHVLTELAKYSDNPLDINLVDPANSGNILSDLLTTSEKSSVKNAAREAIKQSDWNQIVW